MRVTTGTYSLLFGYENLERYDCKYFGGAKFTAIKLRIQTGYSTHEVGSVLGQIPEPHVIESNLGLSFVSVITRLAGVRASNLLIGLLCLVLPWKSMS